MLRRGSLWFPIITILLLAGCEQPQGPAQRGLAALVLTFLDSTQHLTAGLAANTFDRVHCTVLRGSATVFDSDLQHTGGSFQGSIELDAGGGYTVTVQAFLDSELCYSGTSAAFSVTAGKTIEVSVTMSAQSPSAPTNLTAIATTLFRISLTWNDNSTNENGFIIERRMSDTAAWVQIDTAQKNLTVYQDSLLTPGATHYYRITAYNAAGHSAYSNTANAYILATPATPGNLTAVALSSSQIRLNWSDNSNNEDGFRIQYKLGTSLTWDPAGIVGAGIVTFQQNGLAPGQTYDYRVNAYNLAGFSGYSNTASATTSQVPPVAPTNLLAVAISTTQIGLHWHDNSDNEEGFKVERKTGASGLWAVIDSLPANDTTFLNTGLVQLTEYYYRIFAYNSVGNSSYSNEDSARTFQEPPTAPSNLNIPSVSMTWINLAWTDNSSTEDGFIIERKVGLSGDFAVRDSVGIGVVIYQDTGLTPGLYYGYRICAYNGGGNSAYSNTAGSNTTQVPPLAPSGLSAAAVSYSQINLGWSDNSYNESGFAIERKTGLGGTWGAIDSVGADIVFYQDHGLQPMTDYFYRVRAYNTAGNSDYSNEVDDTTFQEAPATPTNLLALTASWSQINLTWNDNSTNEDGFIIQRKINSGGTWATTDTVGPGPGGQIAYQDTGLAPLTNYYYRVCAYNEGGNSGWSNPGNTTTYGLLYVDHFQDLTSFNNWTVIDTVDSRWENSTNGYIGHSALADNLSYSYFAMQLIRTFDFPYNTTMKLWVERNTVGSDSVMVRFLVDNVEQWSWGGPSAPPDVWNHIQCNVSAGSHEITIEVINRGNAYVDEFEVYAN